MDGDPSAPIGDESALEPISKAPGTLDSHGSLCALRSLSFAHVLASPGFYERLASLAFRALVRSAHENAESSSPFQSYP
ncbi:hypothetical protein BRC68_03880 [Halobacteriales archaeon QH_6_64_20]|nr:MAG: hypothetical protein BRC68_03880 [Halobacteriales archaeon QH_6_64_20]